jgi:hypothetical protein
VETAVVGISAAGWARWVSAHVMEVQIQKNDLLRNRTPVPYLCNISHDLQYMHIKICTAISVVLKQLWISGTLPLISKNQYS